MTFLKPEHMSYVFLGSTVAVIVPDDCSFNEVQSVEHCTENAKARRTSCDNVCFLMFFSTIQLNDVVHTSVNIKYTLSTLYIYMAKNCFFPTTFQKEKH